MRERSCSGLQALFDCLIVDDDDDYVFGHHLNVTTSILMLNGGWVNIETMYVASADMVADRLVRLLRWLQSVNRGILVGNCMKKVAL